MMTERLIGSGLVGAKRAPALQHQHTLSLRGDRSGLFIGED
jgi:hypothetical protein